MLPTKSCGMQTYLISGDYAATAARKHLAESYVVDRPIRNPRAKLQTSDRFVLTAEGAASHVLRPHLARPRLG